MTAGDTMIEAIAEAVALKLESFHGARRRLLTLEQAAEYLSVSENQLLNFVSEKRIEPVRMDRRLRFDVRDLDRLIDKSKTRQWYSQRIPIYFPLPFIRVTYYTQDVYDCHVPGTNKPKAWLNLSA